MEAPRVSLSVEMLEKHPVVVSQPHHDKSLDIKLKPYCDLPEEASYIKNTGQLFIKQKMNFCAWFWGYDSEREFTISNTLGQPVYTTEMDENYWRACCFGPHMGYQLNIKSADTDDLVFVYDRPFSFSSYFSPFNFQYLRVKGAEGKLYGTIQQEWSLTALKFTLRNDIDERVLEIQGPKAYTSFLCGDIQFKIMNGEGEQIGTISKQSTGVVREVLYNAQNFCLDVPVDLDPSYKALALAALFLIRYMNYDEEGIEATGQKAE